MWRAVHKLVKAADVSEWFVSLRISASWLRKIIPVRYRHKFPSVGKFIPPSSSFPPNDEYMLTRDKTRFVINRSDYVQWRIFYGVRDNALLMTKKYLTEPGLVLEIGANVGGFSLKLARYIKDMNLTAVKVHAFEPNPQVYNSLFNNNALNPEINSIVALHNYGLGRENSARSFEFNSTNTGAGRVVRHSTAKIRVQIRTLDEFAHNLKPQKILFVKLIVEGFEPEVLIGGWSTIYLHRPPIFMEVTRLWWEENNAIVEEVLAKLRSINYSFLVEEFNELRAMIPHDLSRDQFNLFAFPETADTSSNRFT